jgi:hypothetical protein
VSPLRLSLVFLWLATVAGAASAPIPAPTPAPAPPPPEKPPKKESSEWVFSLLPKSFQKNPLLELTVITEMTEAGKRLPPVSSAAPAYFELFTNGPRQLGHAQGSGKTLPEEEIRRLLIRSLAANGYQPAQPPAQPPSLLILYTWGSHFMLTEGDDENPVLSGNMVARNLLDRAALVGGEKFARKLLDLFEQADAMSLAGASRPPPGGESVFTPALMDFANPVNLFKRADPKNEFLFDQAASDVFYVVASAYDYQSVTEKRRLLLWRTRMTVAAAGVSALQSLPTLVQNAAPYFGKDMAEAAILSRRVMREGRVEIGTPTVVEPSAAPPAAAPKK